MGTNVFNFPALTIPSFRRRPVSQQAKPATATATPNWAATARQRAALLLVESTDPAAATSHPAPLRHVQPLRVLRLVEADQAPGTAGRLRLSGRLSDVCAELDRMASAEMSASRALRA